jgi:hypothetical protein
VVAQALLAREHRVEALGVQVAVVHLVPGGAQVLQHLLVQGGMEAGFDRMAVDDEHAHVV